MALNRSEKAPDAGRGKALFSAGAKSVGVIAGRVSSREGSAERSVDPRVLTYSASAAFT